MWLTVPDNPANILWEGQLELATEEGAKEASRAWRLFDRKSPDPEEAARELPVVSIGQPEVWSLGEVYPPDLMPESIRSRVSEADFYLVRLSCSFRPISKEKEVEWARFLVRLLPDKKARQPIAYDLHPHQVTHEIKRDIKVTVGPSLKFAEVEAKVGELAFGLEYTELQPSISAAGFGEANPSWDYQEVKGIKILGGKWMHLLVKAPRGAETIRSYLDLTAEVKGKGWRLPVVAIRDEDRSRAHLSVQLV
jgi:hypothetical protein